MLRLSRNALLTFGRANIVIPFRPNRPYYLEFNSNKKLPKGTVIPLLEEELNNPDSDERYQHVMDLLRLINVNQLPFMVVKVIALLEEELKNSNSSVRYQRIVSLLGRINVHELPTSILVKAILSRRDILKKKLTTEQEIEYDEDVDNPYGLFLTENYLLTHPSSKQINFENHKFISTEILANAVDPESGYTPITAIVAFLQDLKKINITTEQEQTYNHLTICFFESLIKNGADPTKKDNHENTIFTLLNTIPQKPREHIERILVENELKYPQAKVFIKKIKENFEERKKRKKLYDHTINIGVGLMGATIGCFLSKPIVGNAIGDDGNAFRVDNNKKEDPYSCIKRVRK